MAGYIIYNGFWNKEGPSEPVVMLQDAAARQGITLTPLKNSELCAQLSSSVAVPPLTSEDYVLCWDKDVRLMYALEAVGVRVYNSASAVERCDDKAATHRILSHGGVPQPHTLVAPMTYVNMDADAAEPFVQTVLRTFAFPVVVKECYGSFGRQVYLAQNETALRAHIAAMAARPFLVQQYIAESAGVDHRLYVVGERVVAAMERRNDTDFRANIAGGGVGTAYTPTAEETALARRCCALLGATFAGVDLLTTPHGPLVCEVNASAYLAGITACTGVDVAGEIVSCVVQREAARLGR